MWGNFKFLYNVLKEDINYSWYYIRNIFLYNNKIFIVVFLLLIPIMFIYSIYVFILCFLWYLTFIVRHFTYAWSKVSIVVTCNLTIYNLWLSYFIGDRDWGDPLVFLFNFLWYYPKLLAFNFYYNASKAYYFNKIKFKQVVLILSILLPWRLLIKFITGFSYVSIKIAALCTEEIIGSYECQWNWNEFYSEFIKGSLCGINYYFHNLLFNVTHYKIFLYSCENCKNKIYFNPNWYEKIFKDVPSLTKSLSLSSYNNRFYWIKLIGTEKQDIWHPGVLFNKKTSFTQCISIQSASRYVKINNSDKTQFLYKGLIHEKNGILNKSNVWDYQVISSNKKEQTIFYKMLFPKSVNTDQIKFNNINLFKAFILSLYKEDVYLTKESVKKADEYKLLINRVISMYNNNELDLSYKHCLEYMFSFIDRNNLDLNSEEGLNKIILFNQLVENTNLFDDSVEFTDNLNETSIEVQKALTYFNISN